MAKPVVLLALAVLLLAGCSNAPDAAGAGADSTTPAPTYTTVVGKATGPAFTDALHLLARPDVTPKPPTGPNDLRLAVPGFSNQLAGAASQGAVERQVWAYELPRDFDGLVGNASLWVEVKGTVVNNPNPLAGGCFWSLSLFTGGVAGDGYPVGCLPEPTTVAPGVRELQFPIDLPSVSLSAGTRLEFEFYTNDFGRSPDAAIDVLTYSVAHDSRIRFVGLELPLDSSLLLQATA
ncbi:MAG: hypothetical protein QOJ26_1792 [Thermoplasmata archaeon]|jgi:hypothetical protein|nr:hypothetical protein [Thermoplasmata archaeon]MEA3166913.1 hypothetical protein [Thermoplasmata archaeon]